MLFVMKMDVRSDGIKDRTYGQYILDYNPTIQEDETFRLLVVADRREAKKFASVDEMMAYYMQISPNVPKRLNGEPNRPLTGWCMVYEPFDLH